MEEMILNIVIGVTALLLVGLSIPLIRGRVRPNWFYGFRTPSTVHDEQLWYEVNARTGRDLFWVGIGGLVITALHVLGEMSTQVFTVIAVVWMTGGALLSVVHGFVMIRRSRQ